jgi:hypothetical protein
MSLGTVISFSFGLGGENVCFPGYARIPQDAAPNPVFFVQYRDRWSGGVV